ncbi:MAG: NAD(P)-dependent oxidoreductase [Pirellulales bacterium]
MRVAVTGGTGFIGRYILAHLVHEGHEVSAWHRPTSDRAGLEHLSKNVEWIEGDLGDAASATALTEGADAVIHAALYHPGGGFRGGEGDIADFVEKNVVGTIRLIEAARAAGAARFLFVSTCAVHEQILDDRPLDEAHPLWPSSHYGAHKAAIEKFVHSYGLGRGYTICALRPTGVYGAAHPVEQSKWFDLVSRVVGGEDVTCEGGGKEVHAADVAKALRLLLTAEGVAGQAYSCYDRYVSRHEVATIAKRLAGSSSTISGQPSTPKHQIVTEKIRGLGMSFGGDALLSETIGQLVEHARG